MLTTKLSNILNIVSDNLSQNKILFAIIGALALGFYGLPRYTSDIDLLTEGRFKPSIKTILNKLGYTCFQESDIFAQFDSDLGVYGNLDFMFVNTLDGQEILNRSILVSDSQLGEHRIIQPSDYIILKLMAIANNPDRIAQDEADITSVLKSSNMNLIPAYFEPINPERIKHFALKFDQEERFEKYSNAVFSKSTNAETYKL
ncbi:MAG: hypothetical protein MUP22_16460 [Desulfobacterales bacterium]|nr:hypothetical protein [Desulfobacterales bacterium]